MNAVDILLGSRRSPQEADRPAILWRDQTVTYGDLAAAVARAADAFASVGLAADERVLFLSEDSPRFVASYLGAIRAGGVAVAVNPRLGPDDLRAVLSDCEPAVVILNEDGAAAHDRARARSAFAPKAVLRGTEFDRLAAASNVSRASAVRAPHDMAFWIYTSGTTGRIKAAIHRHQDVLPSDIYLREVLGVGPGDRLFSTSKLFFAYALGTILFGTLRVGATAILHDGRSDPESVTTILARNRPSVVFSVPTLYRAMLAADAASAGPFRTVRHYVSAGERLPAPIFSRWREATGVEILDGMGTTETIYMLLSNRPGRACPGASGTPAPGVEARLGAEEGRVAAPGASGILDVRIPSCASGYWRQPAESARVFRDGWFSTGDLYRIDAGGFWHHQGRADDLFKVAGQWVVPSEVEEIAAAESGILDAALVGATDADGLAEGVLFVVPKDRAVPFDAARLARLLADRLPPHKRPRRIEITADIPRTATGKIQRFKLRRLIGAG